MYSLTVSMVYELKEMTTKVSKQELTEMFDNFLYFMMKNFETEIVVMGARLALKTYRIDVDESKLEHYDEFAERFSKYI